MPGRAPPAYLFTRSDLSDTGKGGAASMQIRFAIPSPLRSYTAGAASVALPRPATAMTLDDALKALNAAYPGIAFRMIDELRQLRPHMQVFVNGSVQRNLAAPLPVPADVMIVAALSGG